MKNFLLALVIGSGLLCADPYIAKDFSSLLGKTKGISDELLQMHFTLYQGYVKNTNALLRQLGEMEQSQQINALTYGALKRRLGWEFDGMRLHELYFENLGGNGQTLSENSAFGRAIKKQYGSITAWKEQFIATGLIRGIGWVVVYKDSASNRLITDWVNQHDVGHLVLCAPILIMDVWEHAYLTQFGLNRKEYIDAFWANINWDIVEKRMK